MRHDQVGIEALVPGRRGFLVARERELVLLFTRHAPGLGGQFGALAHAEAGARLGDAGQLRLEIAGSQPEPGSDSRTERAAAETLHQDVAIVIRVDDRCVADGVGAAGDAGIDLAERDLVADQDGGLERGAARAREVECRRFRREAASQHAFPSQVPVARMLDNRATRNVAERRALKVVFFDDAFEHRRHHVLVRALRVGGVRPGERYAQSAEDGHASRSIVVHLLSCLMLLAE